MAKVSVLIPVYNVEKYLRQCMDSVVKQTMEDLEIICINDGSTDASPNILREYAKKDKRIHIIDKKNSGYGASMNLGLQAATGEYIGIVESDDFADLNMFDKLYAVAKEQNVELVKSDFWVYCNNENSYVKTIKDYYYGKVISPEQVPDVFWLNPSIWSNLYRRSWLLENDIWFHETPGASFQDLSFRIKAFACAKRVFFINEAFLHYRRGEDYQTSSVCAEDKVYCVCDEYKEVRCFFSKKPDLKKKYGVLVENIKWAPYWWNFCDRKMDVQSKVGFVNSIADEYIHDMQERVLVEDYWEPWAWNRLHVLIHNRKKFLYDDFITKQRQAMISSLLFANNVRFGPVIIYGAGLVGQSVAAALLRNKIPIECFVVASMEHNPSHLENISVQLLDSVLDKRKECLVLIATKIQSQEEILFELYSKGFEHVVAMTQDIRQFLQC